MKMIHITIYFPDSSYLDGYVDEVFIDYNEGQIEMHSYDDEENPIMSFNMKSDGIKSFRIGASA